MCTTSSYEKLPKHEYLLKYEYMLLSTDNFAQLNKWAADRWRLVCCDKNWLYLERPVIQENVDELAHRRNMRIVGE